MFALLLFIITLMRPNTAPRRSLGRGDTPVPSCWRATPDTLLAFREAL